MLNVSLPRRGERQLLSSLAGGSTGLVDTWPIQWPTATKFQFIIGHRGLTEAGFYYEGNDFSQAEHSGTHTDAPAHFSQVTDDN